MKINKTASYLLLLLSFSISSCVINKNHAEPERVKAGLTKRFPECNFEAPDTVLISKRAAIKIAKKTAFQTYGYWHISYHQRPFDKIFLGNYLSFCGTLRKGWKGGVCEVVVDRRNGKVIYLMHGK